MTTWPDRLRVALVLSPALLVFHVWITASSNGYLLEKFGMWKTFGLEIISSVTVAYIIVLATTLAIKLWQKK